MPIQTIQNNKQAITNHHAFVSQYLRPAHVSVIVDWWVSDKQVRGSLSLTGYQPVSGDVSVKVLTVNTVSMLEAEWENVRLLAASLPSIAAAMERKEAAQSVELCLTNSPELEAFTYALADKFGMRICPLPAEVKYDNEIMVQEGEAVMSPDRTILLTNKKKI